ncbi:MAG: excinuclease ABC subunit UvrA [bacterium]
MDKPVIRVLGARQNNLKNLDLELPLYELTVITGLSGSGKSSLAFDTLYAEGHRRYAESFSAYARQFLERLDRPQVERIEGIPPAIAIHPVNPIKTARSTVATLTELAEYMKLLFSRVATLWCSRCGREVRRDTPQELARELVQKHSGSRALITFPVRTVAGLPLADMEAGLRGSGYFRVYHEGAIREVSEALLAQLVPGTLQVVSDRVVLERGQLSRLAGSLESAFQMGRGQLAVILRPGEPDEERHPASTAFHCPWCDIAYQDPVSNLFSFNTPLGACEACRGFGRTIGVDLDLVLPDRSLTLRQGAIRPWNTGSYREAYEELMAFCRKEGVPVDVPFQDLQPAHQSLILDGCPNFYGVKGFFDWLETKTYKMHIRVLLSRYRSYDTCKACGGSRFRHEALCFKIGGRSLADVYAMTIEEAHAFFRDLSLSPFQQEVAARLLEEILSRLYCLQKIGLGYLTLDRQSRTLSGGEVERAHLTTALGSSLVNTLYILDEPSIGLHARDTKRLLEILKEIRDRQNTVVVVEHDPEVILAADTLLDLGPLAGEKGGKKVYFGPPEGILKAPETLTARYLLDGKAAAAERPIRRRPVSRAGAGRTECLTVRGASEHNLAGLTVSIPLQRLACISGVSGSGKSTLMKEILHKGLLKLLGRGTEKPGRHLAIEGHEKIEDVILVDSSPLGNTPRANPVTYVKAFDGIRALFAAAPLSRLRGYDAGMFSFNAGRGRCPACQGEGFEKVEMQFLADVFVVCPECGGGRFKKEVLEVTYQGRTIGQVLEMTVQEGAAFFHDAPRVARPLEVLQEIGLGYLRLGQPLNTLSGGEAQRLRLAAHILRSRRPHTLFLFDEPTTGLHLHDIQFLLKTFDALLEQGHSLVVIEHNLEVLRHADYILDLGPEGGDQGGRKVAEGAPEEIVREPASHTGRALEAYRSSGARAALHKAKARRAGPGATTQGPAGRAGRAGRSGRSGLPPDGLVPAAVTAAAATAAAAATDAGAAALQADGGGGRPDKVACAGAGHGADRILIEGAREHNLKGIRVEIPRDRIVVITGPSGSGKSTLAFDILFAEGQRRFLESLSAYARQYIQPMSKPDVDRIQGVPPTVAVEQRLARGGRRSTVSTLTETYHYLRLLYAKIGVPYCPGCGSRLSAQKLDAIYEDILAHFRKGPVCLLAPLIKGKKGHHRDVFRKLERMGYSQVRLDGEILDIRNIFAVDRYKEHDIDVVVADLDVRHASVDYLQEKVEEALRVGRGDMQVAGRRKGAVERYYSGRLYCSRCGIGLPEPDPRFFSFNSRYGACPSCDGLGVIAEDDGEGNGKGGGREGGWGEGGAQDKETCPECGGTRLQVRALHVRIGGKNIAECVALPPAELQEFLRSVPLTEREKKIARPILKELEERLYLMERVGLGYLGMGRGADTLSQGEARRVRLIAQLAANMRGLCYILDEPTIGLHPRDNERLLQILRLLRDRGNSIVIVEHDEETIRKADHVIDLGPGAGKLGGEVVAEGPLASILATERSLTGRILRQGSSRFRVSSRRKLEEARFGWIRGAQANNLCNIDVAVPIGRLTVVTGVSGSGKSTLVREVLYKGLRRKIHRVAPRPGRHKALSGWTEINRVVEVDSAPVGKTPRSVPATYVGVFDEVRKIFALLPDSRARGYTAGRFSFNLKEGRCGKCAGQGRIRMEMSFLPDVYVCCDACQGRRYNDETLAVAYKGRSIAEVLALTVSEARSFFSEHPRLDAGLGVLEDIGLGYLALGQPTNTLSGGETQRLKLAEELCRSSSSHTLYVLDEPTTGLHLADIESLMGVIHRLVDRGNTVVVIEHNTEVIRQADYLIDLGPEGGSRGGRVMAAGSPEQLLRKTSVRSHTLDYLRQAVGAEPGRRVAAAANERAEAADAGRGVER